MKEMLQKEVTREAGQSPGQDRGLGVAAKETSDFHRVADNSINTTTSSNHGDPDDSGCMAVKKPGMAQGYQEHIMISYSLPC